MEVDKGQKTTVEGMIYIISIKLTQKKKKKSDAERKYLCSA